MYIKIPLTDLFDIFLIKIKGRKAQCNNFSFICTGARFCLCGKDTIKQGSTINVHLKSGHYYSTPLWSYSPT